MIWKSKTATSPWKRWFAWYPVELLSPENIKYTIWLQVIERKRVYFGGDYYKVYKYKNLIGSSCTLLTSFEEIEKEMPNV